MELPKSNGSGFGEMFSGLKSKLGFADAGYSSRESAYHDEEAYDSFDDYADYDEFAEYAPSAANERGAAYDGAYDDVYNEATNDEFAEYAPREFGSNGSYGASDNFGSSDAFGSRNPSRKVRAPKLVSIDDVRAHAQVPDSLKRNPLPERKVTKATSVVANWGSRLVNRQDAGAGDSTSAPRSAGLRSLFDSTATRNATANYRTGNSAGDDDLNAMAAASVTEASMPNDPGFLDYEAGAQAYGSQSFDTQAGAQAYGSQSFDAQAGAQAYDLEAEAGASSNGFPSDAASNAASYDDPYVAYVAPDTAGQQSFVAKRHLSIIAPMSYGDVEGVARALKAGDVVVLVLTRTPDALSKRVLDFSFGAASALDASVDSVANKVFAITRDHGLTPSERTELRSQGVL